MLFVEHKGLFWKGRSRVHLATALELAADRYPDIDAIVTPSARFSYGEWNRRINSVSWGLKNAGVRPGDRVAICAQNGEAPATTYFAIQKAGAAAVMLNARWKHGDIAYAIHEAGVRAILYDQTTRNQVLQAAREAGAGDSAGKVVPISCSSDYRAQDPGTIAYETLAANPTHRAPDIAPGQLFHEYGPLHFGHHRTTQGCLPQREE